MIRIYGASDDLVEVEADGPDRGDEYDAGAGGVCLLVGTEDAGVRVHMIYGARGTWKATIDLVDDQKPIPWPVRVENAPVNGTNEGPYSVMACIDCPIGTPWKKVWA